MKVGRILYQLAFADFFERARRYSFLITLGFTLIAAYAYVPPASANYLTLGLGNYRGVYNSAWVGAAVAILTSALLSLPGFYLVKNSIELDTRTGVGQIIATTPLRKMAYTLGKTLSNTVVLSVLVGIIMIGALAMQLLRGEDFSINLWALISPFIFVTLPTMALIASLAVLFETISWLRGTLGNVVYFVFWIGMLVFTLAISSQAQSTHNAVSPTSDIFGVYALLGNMTAAAQQAFPGYHGSFALGGTAIQGHVQTFVWNGIVWTPQILLGRLFWIAVAIGIACLASVFFHRFDQAIEGKKKKRAKNAPSVVMDAVKELPEEHAPMITRLTPLHSTVVRLRILRVLWAEIQLSLKGTHWVWYIIALGLIIGGWLIPIPFSGFILAAAWIWPLRHWSAMGNREVTYHTQQLVFSTPRALTLQLVISWFVGLLITICLGSGVLGHLILTGDWLACFSWAVGAFFVPTLALSLGVWSRGNKLFEVLYMLVWYLGLLNHIPILDFVRTTDAAAGLSISLLYLACTVVLFGAAMVGRRLQVNS